MSSSTSSRVDLDDRALDDVAVVELDDRGVDGVGERHAAEVVERRPARSGRPRRVGLGARRSVGGLGDFGLRSSVASGVGLGGRASLLGDGGGRSPPSRPDPTTRLLGGGTTRGARLTGGRDGGPRVEAERPGYRSGRVAGNSGVRPRRRRARSRSSGWSSVGGCRARSRPGVTAVAPRPSSPARAREQLELAGVKQVVQRSNSRFVAARVAHRRHLVDHAGGASNVLARLEVAHREVRPRTRSPRARPPGRSAAAMPAEHRRSRRARRAGRTRPGTGRSRRRTRRRTASSRTSSSSNSAGQPVGGRGRGRGATNVGREVDADDLDAPPRQRERVPPGPAADVEHPHPRLEPERVDEEVDLLLGALGERVPQVGRPEELGDRVEPVGIPGWHAGHTERLRNTLGESAERQGARGQAEPCARKGSQAPATTYVDDADWGNGEWGQRVAVGQAAV